jgi:hypothetical protein
MSTLFVLFNYYDESQSLEDCAPRTRRYHTPPVS